MTSILPSDEELDEVSFKLCGAPFHSLPTPNEKARVLELTVLCLQAADTNEIASQVENIEKTICEGVEKISDNLEWMSTIGTWFDKSKLWDGECYVSNR